MSHEVELKLALPARAVPALRRHPLVAGAHKLGKAGTLDNTYYDTPELSLKARRVAVRTRRQGRSWLQTVKCAAVSSGGLSQRPEWEQPYVGSFDFSAIDDPATARLLARKANKLVPAFTTRFRRETRRYAPRDGVSILLMIDTGSIEAAGRSAPICELELELEAGQPLDLFELACELARSVPLMPADVSKAERGYRLFLDQPTLPARAEPSTIGADEDVVDAFRSLAHGCLRQWQANASAAAAGDHDPAYIHQLRVALRRLRSLVRIFAPALPAQFVSEWKSRLRDNTNRFGNARDLDVLRTELLAPIEPAGLADASIDLAGLRDIATSARDAARIEAERQLDPAGQGLLMLEFAAALLRLPRTDLGSATDLRSFARLQLGRLRKRARRHFHAASALVPTRLHSLRIGAKQLRYGIEFFAPLFPARRVERYLADLVRAQNTLGFLQDVDTARVRLEAWAGDKAGLRAAAAFVIGWHGRRYARLRRRVLRECELTLWGKAPW